MRDYIIKRLLLIIPTLFGIMLLNFFIIQLAPGGPVEQLIAQLKGNGNSIGNNLTGNTSENIQLSQGEKYIAAQGLDTEIIEQIKEDFGFDKPIYLRFFSMLANYISFDFGNSFFKGKAVTDLIFEKLPVSISLGLWTSLITYLIAIPLGIRKAVEDGSKFDFWTSTAIFIGYSIPAFLFAILLIIPFINTSEVRNTTYRPIFKFFFWPIYLKSSLK